jgi:hypothetical protein
MEELVAVKEYGMTKEGHSMKEAVEEEERQLAMLAPPPVLQLALQDFGCRRS